MEKEKNYRHIIERIVEFYQEKLNDWEVEFISSVYDWHIIRQKKLSYRQKEIILKINGKMLGRG